MPCVISIIGRSNSGKTTLMEKLIPIIKANGLKIGSVKNTSHGFSLDHPDKDSYRHKVSGTTATVINGPELIGVVRDTHSPWGLGKIVSRFLNDMDIVLAEGFKQEDYPKIEVITSFTTTSKPKNSHHSPSNTENEKIPERIIDENDPLLLGIISDITISTDKKKFHPDSVAEISEFIFQYYQSKDWQKNSFSLFVNGKPIGLNPFMQELIAQTMLGIVGTLKRKDKDNTPIFNVTLELNQETKIIVNQNNEIH